MVSRPIVSSDQAIPELRADGTRIEVHSAVIDERIATWRDALGPLVDHLDRNPSDRTNHILARPPLLHQPAQVSGQVADLLRAA
jgi:hypothetical protein